MASEAFSTANRALRVKRRAFSREITSFLNDAWSGEGVSKEVFNEKKGYFENIWEEIVTATDSCINLLDDEEDERGEIIDGLKELLEELQDKKQRLTWLEEEIEKKI